MSNRVIGGGKSAANGTSRVYIGRGTLYGNPYHIGPDGTREEVIAKYQRDFNINDNLRKLCRENLSGKTLVCHCAPLACHGDVIKEYLEALEQLESLF